MDDKLKCSCCKNHLSYFPVFLSSKNESFCGRCTILEGTTCYHNEPFEAACESFKFPCRYQREGCFEELVPKEVPLHEEQCRFRVVPCLINKLTSCLINNPVPCQWTGSLSTLVQHCQREHSDIISKDGEFQLDLSVSEENDRLIEQGKDLYLFTTRFAPNEKLLRCALFNFYKQTKNDQTCALLSFKNGDRSVSLDLKAREIGEKRDLTELYLNSLERKDDLKLVQGKITLLGNRNLEEKKFDREENNITMVPRIECYRCKRIARPPVYRTTGSFEIICSSCYSPANYDEYECYDCKRLWAIEDSILTELAEKMTLQCKNYNQGCTYAAKVPKIKDHETMCDFAIVNCAFDESCSWTSLLKCLPDHFSQSHRDILIDPSEIVELTLNDENTKYGFLEYKGCFFRLAYVSTEESRCKWSVQVIGRCEEKFKYQIYLVEDRNKKVPLSSKKLCSELTEENRIFEDSQKYFYVDWKPTNYLKAAEAKEKETKIKFTVEIDV